MNNYDNESDFTGEIAAKLIAGANDSTMLNQDILQIVSRGMQQYYQKALTYYQSIVDSDRDDDPDLDVIWQTRAPIPNDALQSLAMQQCESMSHNDKGGTFAGWLALSPTDFASQRFDRLEIHRWIKAKQMLSVYDFENGSHNAQTAMRAIHAASGHVASPLPAPVVTGTPAPVENVGALAGVDGDKTATRKRPHQIGHLIAEAQSRCTDPSEVNAVYEQMIGMVREGKYHLLIGVTEFGIQYLDANNNGQEFRKKQLAAYIRGDNLTRKRPRKSA